MLGKADVVLAGVKEIVGVYGLDIDSMLGSVKTEEISNSGDKANMRVTFDFLGEEFSSEAPMVRTEQGWYAE